MLRAARWEEGPRKKDGSLEWVLPQKCLATNPCLCHRFSRVREGFHLQLCRHPFHVHLVEWPTQLYAWPVLFPWSPAGPPCDSHSPKHLGGVGSEWQAGVLEDLAARGTSISRRGNPIEWDPLPWVAPLCLQVKPGQHRSELSRRVMGR